MIQDYEDMIFKRYTKYLMNQITTEQFVYES